MTDSAIQAQAKTPVPQSAFGVTLSPKAFLGRGVIPGGELLFSYRHWDKSRTFAIGAQVGVGLPSEFSFAGKFHWTPTIQPLSKVRTTRFDLELDLGMAGIPEFPSLRARLSPGLLFQVGKKGLLSFRPVSFGVWFQAEQLSFLEAGFLSVGYAWGF